MAITKVGLKLLVTLTLLLASSITYAQDADGDTAAADSADADDLEDDDEDADDEELCALDPANCVKVDMAALAEKAVEAEMYAVQQIWALRARRFETNVYAGFTMNDQFVAHPGPGIGLNYYINNVLAVGVNGNLYAGLNSTSDFNFQTSRAARIGQPITEYQWNANLNVTYVPAYGKFAAFQNFIFHYDFYVVAGGGVISTRPIAVIDPDNRTFDFKIKPTFGAGGGIRIFFTRYLAAMLEIRDYIFFDELESNIIQSGFTPEGTPKAQDEATWIGDGSSFTNNVQAQLGLSLFLPLTWKYRLPK